MSKSGKVLYIVNFNSSKVLTFDTDSFEKLIEEYPIGKKPLGIISAMNDTKFYVSNYGDNTVTVIKIKNKEN